MWKVSSFLVGAVLILVTIGIVMLASTSGGLGLERHHDPTFFVKRQVVWFILATLVCLITAKLHYFTWRHFAVFIALVSLALLVMTILPEVGVEIKGSRRWLRMGPINFQPSELAKLSMIMLLAWWMARVKHNAVQFGRGLVVPMAMLAVFAGLILAEPDFGTTLLVGLVGFSILFVAGTRFGYLVVSGVGGLVAFLLLVMQNPLRMRRVIAFLNPEKYAQDEAFQLLNAIHAFILGEGAGVGLGQSAQKRFYLPEAHTDFIFAIIGEELGLGASLAVVVLFLTIFCCGLWISFSTQDLFGKLVGFGITMMITLQAVINIGVVTGCLPTKGLALPFISFGGSHLVMSGAMIGILISIARHSGESEVNAKDGGWV